MLNCREQKAESRRQKAARGRSSRILIFCLLPTAFCLLLSGCRRDMQDQPKAIAYRENSFFKDGTGSRPLVEGTVPRGYLREDREMYLGKKSAVATQPGPIMTQPAGGQPTAPQVRLPTTPVSAASANPYPDDVDTLPFAITKDDMKRGQERYNIYCSFHYVITGFGVGIVA